MQAQDIAQPWAGTVRQCDQCGADFKLRARKTQRFCSLPCAAKGRTRRARAPQKRVPWQERFWRYLTPGRPDECWEWQGSRDQHGYGRLQRGGKDGGIIKAHRASWELHNGPIPPGKAVCHKCDNPPCCNPADLFLGTMRDNTQDMLAKGRHVAPVGASNGKTRIPDETVVAIRESAALGVSYVALAQVYGLTDKYVGYLVRGERRAAAGGPIR